MRLATERPSLRGEVREERGVPLLAATESRFSSIACMPSWSEGTEASQVRTGRGC